MRPPRQGITPRDISFRYPSPVIDFRRLESILKLLVEREVVHAGQLRDVMNRGRDGPPHSIGQTCRDVTAFGSSSGGVSGQRNRTHRELPV